MDLLLLLNIVLDRIEYIVLMIGKTGCRFIATNGNAMVMSFREFTTETNIVDACFVITEIRWEM